MDIIRFASLAQLLPLSHEHLAQIAPYASERVIPAGRRLLLGGPFAQELVLIAGGRAVVRCAGETVAELGPGDVFGDLAPERPVYDTASVIAHTDLRLVVFSARALRELRRACPQSVDALVAACGIDPSHRTPEYPAPLLKLVRDAA
jgi:CRP-like cAMP-binding protein